MSLRALWVVLIIVPMPLQAQDCVGLGDIASDSHVNLADWAALATCFRGPEESLQNSCSNELFLSADLDTNGSIDLRDASLFFARFGDEYFVYNPLREDKEAERLALEISGELRAPDDLYDRIHADLAMIRATYPQTDVVQDRAPYHPTHLVVRLHPGTDPAVIDPLNNYFQSTAVHLVTDIRLVNFCDTLNMVLMAVEYEQVIGVKYAYPDYYGGSGDEIWIEDLGSTWRYTLLHDWGDCLAGCICSRIWVVDVNETAQLLSDERNCE